jgi:repressor LexA
MEKYKEQVSGVQSFFSKHKRMPSYSEAARVFNVKSKESAYRIMQKLITLGFVTKDTVGKLLPGPYFQKSQLKVLGLVEAGFATPAEESLLDTMSLDEYIIQKPDASFMLQVKGDSMFDAGIRDGDMVVVERTTQAKVGEIVIAQIDGGWTMKYLRKKGSVLYLEPANKEYEDIFPKEELQIQAVVRAVIRKYE